MAPQRHRYTRCIVLTGERSNKSNERAVCRFCSEANGASWALTHALLCNTKKLVKNHLRRCAQYRAARAAGADDAVVFTEDEDNAEDASAAHTDATVPAPAPAPRRKRARAESDVRPIARKKLLDEDAALARIMSGMRPTAKPIRPSETARAALALEQLVLRATLANRWTFAWLEQPASRAMLRALNATVSLPSTAALSTRVLDDAGAAEMTRFSTDIQRDRLGCALLLDSWRHVQRAQELGFLLTTSQGGVHVLDMERVDLDAVRQQRDALPTIVRARLAQLAAVPVHVGAIIADSSRQYAQMRLALRRDRPDLMHLPCLAWQLDALLCDAVRSVPEYEQTITRAIEVSAWMDATQATASSVYRGQEMHDGECEDWIQLQQMTGRLVCARQMLQERATRVEPSEDQGKDASASSNHDRSDWQSDVLHLIRDPQQTFWPVLTELDTLLATVAHWMEMLRNDQSRLPIVAMAFESISQTLSISRSADPHRATMLRASLDAQWREWEHPLVILAVVLHPALGWPRIAQSSSWSGITLVRLGCWARAYFQAFFGEPPQSLLRELVEYVEGDRFWCAAAAIDAFADRSATNVNATAHATGNALEMQMDAALTFHVLPYWKSCAADCPELARLALHLLAPIISSAGMDDLFGHVDALRDQLDTRPDRVLAAIRVRGRAMRDQQHAATEIDPVAMRTADLDRQSHLDRIAEKARMEASARRRHARFRVLLERVADREQERVSVREDAASGEGGQSQSATMDQDQTQDRERPIEELKYTLAVFRHERETHSS